MKRGERELSAAHLLELAEARRLLESPGVAVKASNLIGRPIEAGHNCILSAPDLVARELLAVPT